MKKIIGLAMLAGAAVAGTASTVGVAAAETSVSGNVAITSNYVWRGFQQSSGNPAIQGGFDLESDMFYAGVWGSSVDFGGTGDNVAASSEFDLYAGFTPTAGPVTFDIGAIGYFYPGADDDGGDFDFFEGYAGASIAATDALEFGGKFYYSPEFFGETGAAYFVEGNASFALSEAFSLSGAVGYQDFDEDSDASYTTWNVGGTFAVHGFELDLRYHGLDIDDADEQISFTVSRAL
jgi:uncharacterized protein (TIGR02001 family)